MRIPAKGTAADSHCLYSQGHVVANGKCVICGKRFKPPIDNTQQRLFQQAGKKGLTRCYGYDTLGNDGGNNGDNNGHKDDERQGQYYYTQSH